MPDWVIAIFVAIPLASVVANVLLWQAYFADDRRPRSRVFLVVAVASTNINVWVGVIGWLALRRLLGSPPLEGSAIITTVAAAFIFAVPIFFGIMFVGVPRWTQRRNARRK